MFLGSVENSPILEFDDDSSLTTNEQFFSNGKKEFWRFNSARKKGIDKCIIFLPRSFSDLENIFKYCVLVYEFKSASTISPVYLYKNEVFVALCPLGGPASANLIEELSHVGIKTFLAFGTCGCLNSKLDATTLIIPTSAIRDEGISYHYLPPSRDVRTSEKVNNALANTLKEQKLNYVFAKIWTTDAIYRETPSRIERRKAEGAIAVEMECASIAAVCKYKGLDFGELLYISDSVSSGDWKWRIYNKLKLREKLFYVCYNAIKAVE